MKKILENIAKVAIYATFFVPLVVIPSSFIFPFIVPKILAFRTLAEIAFAAYAVLIFINWREYRPRPTSITLAVALFFLSFGVSTFVGVDWYHSLWDNHERMLGFFTILHYFAYYLVCVAVFKNWKDWRSALRIFLLAGSIVMFLGLIQVFSPEFLLNRGSDRVVSTLGNSIYVSGYGLFLFFTSLLLFAREDKTNYGWMGFYVVTGLFGIGGVFFGGSRGAILGLVGGILAMLFFYALSIKNNRKLTIGLRGGLVLFLVLIGLAGLNRQSAMVKSIPAFGRLFGTTWADITEGPRMIAWKIAVKSWQEKPVFGWGPNNFFYAFNKYYNPRSLGFGYGETWFDNAHNVVLNTLAVQGAVGLFTYLSIFVLAIWSLFSGFRKDNLNIHLAVLGSSFLVAHLVQNVTVFENPTSYLYFMVWVAMINSMTYSGVGVESGQERKVDGTILSMTGIVLLIFIFIFNIQPARANMKTLAAMKILGGGSPSAGLAAIDEAIKFSSPHVDDIRSDLSRTIFDWLNANKNLDKPTAEKFLSTAYTELQKNISLHPLDIRNYLTLAQFGQMGYGLTNQSSYMLDAHNYMSKALEYSPDRQQIIYGLAVLKFQFNQKTEAIALLQKALDSNLTIGESYWRLAYFYQLDGQTAKAKEILALAAQNNITPDSMGQDVIGLVSGAKASK
ncbi:MAG: O-antigen ligase family protein [bacterium]|nr:O-antigen ligase family protein [bacterium]